MDEESVDADQVGFVNFMLDNLRANPDLKSDPQTLLAPFLSLKPPTTTQSGRTP